MQDSNVRSLVKKKKKEEEEIQGNRQQDTTVVWGPVYKPWKPALLKADFDKMFF